MIELVSYTDDDGEVYEYTETVPDVPAQEEPFCYSCSDARCYQCDPGGAEIVKARKHRARAKDEAWNAGGFSEEAPF